MVKVLILNSFKKDLKRYKNDTKRQEKIVAVVKLLESGAPIPASMRPHQLIGNYKGFKELHIEGDLLLIWREANKQGEEVIYLVRLGSHSEIFG